MRCDRARRLLALGAGGDLTGQEARRVADHLAGCPECHVYSESLSSTVAWLRSEGAPPVSESEFTELRRRVWGRIGEKAVPSRRGLTDWGRLGLACGAAAAILAAFLIIRRATQETAAVAGPARSPAVSTATAPAAGSETGGRGAPEMLSRGATREPVPAERIAASPPTRLRRHRPLPAEPAGVDRIEFRTANPNVRIIWLVRKGEEKSSSAAPGRNQEVS